MKPRSTCHGRPALWLDVKDVGADLEVKVEDLIVTQFHKREPFAQITLRAERFKATAIN